MVGPIRTWWWLLEIWTVVVAGLFISEHTEYHYGVVVVGVALFVLCMVSCFAINFGDPGVIVKPNFSEAYRNAKEVTEMIKNGIHNPVRNVTVGGKVYKYSYCMRCHHFRPPESGHCYTCDSCIEHWDHHCPIFGGCVGKKNIVAFHIMCLSQAVLWTFWISCSAFAAANVAREDTSLEALGRCKTLMGVTVGIIGAAVLPVLLSKSKLEKNLCVPKAKPRRTSNDISGDWSNTGIPDVSVRSVPVPQSVLHESSTEYNSSSEFTSSESSPETHAKTGGKILHPSKLS